MNSQKRIALGVLLSTALVASAPAQCVIGVYADTAGTQGDLPVPGPFVPTGLYVVMHVESTVAGVAYSLNYPLPVSITPVSYGPNGLGLNVPRGGGDNIGLGECALGFNDNPVLVASYSMLIVDSPVPSFPIEIFPNLDEDPLYPVYADCADNLIPCTGTSALYVYGVGIEGKSMGAVKSLYASE